MFSKVLNLFIHFVEKLMSFSANVLFYAMPRMISAMLYDSGTGSPDPIRALTALAAMNVVAGAMQVVQRLPLHIAWSATLATNLFSG